MRIYLSVRMKGKNNDYTPAKMENRDDEIIEQTMRDIVSVVQ